MSVASCFPLPARVRGWVYVAALLAVAAFSQTESNFTPLVVGVIAALIAWLLVDSPDIGRVHNPVPGRVPAAARGTTSGAIRWLAAHARTIVLNLIVLGAGVYLWYEAQWLNEPDHPNLIVALAHFIEVLVFCKFFESKSPRNCVQMYVLSLLLIVSATMLSNSGLYFFAILTIYFGSLFYAIMVLNLAVETDRFGAGGPVPAVVPASSTTGGHPGRSQAVSLLRRDLRDTAKQCLGLVLPVVVALFLLLPRHRVNPFLTSVDVGAYQTGFSETVKLGEFGRLESSEDEVMRVTLRRGNEDVSGEFSDLYLRGQVLDQYSGNGLWSHAPVSAGTDTSAADTEGPAAYEDPPRGALSIQVTYELKYTRGGWLPIVAPCVPPEDEQFIYSRDDMTCRLGPSWPRGTRPIKFTLEWAKELAPLAQGKAHCTPGVLATAASLTPEGAVMLRPTVRVSPQIEELAHGLIKGIIPGENPVDASEMRSAMTIFENYLRMHYAYSMTFLRVDKSLEQTTDFLLNRKATGGNCEYFASAMVMMCRAVGLNARMVSGYHSDEYYLPPFGSGYFLVRQKHAHSWVEVYFPGEGWVRSDPTPGGAAANGGDGGGGWFRDLTRVVQGTWITSVVSFDNDSRAALGHWISARIDGLLDWQPFSAGFVVVLWGVALALVVVFIRLRRRFRRLQPLLASTQGIPHRQARLSAHVAFLDDLLRLFDHGAARRPDLTPLEFLEPHFRRLAPVAADRGRWLVVTAYGVRFGGLHIDADLKHEIAEALRGVKSAVRARAGG